MGNNLQNILDNIRGKNLKKLKKHTKNLEQKYNEKIKNLEFEISQLKYLLYHTTDITNMKPAQDRLRQYQRVLIQMMKIFDYICRKHNISYWLDFGTLLGAIRHNGFIPWDDDLDVGVLRDDYEKLPDILEKELSPYGFTVNIGGIGFKYSPIVRLLYAGLPWGQIDIFPYDNYYKKIETKEEEEILFKDKTECCFKLIKNHLENLSLENLRTVELELRNKYILKGNKPLEHGTIYLGSEFNYKPSVCAIDYDKVFPLKRHSFENIECYVPNNFEAYLTERYGNYMTFPQKLFQHSSEVVWLEAESEYDELLEKISKTASSITNTNSTETITTVGGG